MNTSTPTTSASRTSAARAARITLAALACASLAATTFASGALADTTSGSLPSYTSGVTCTLPGPPATKVALASWPVNGHMAFALGDVSNSGGTQSTYPLSGTAVPATAANTGLSKSQLAQIDGLIAHFGSATPSQVAEVSAAIGGIGGHSPLQSQCVGQGGTSATDVATISTISARSSGPYAVTVSAPTNVAAGSKQKVSAAVVSAFGTPVNGARVTFVIAGHSMVATTNGAGIATVDMVAGKAASTKITASTSSAPGLSFVAAGSGSVFVGAPITVSGATALTVMPNPVLNLASSASNTLALKGTPSNIAVSVSGVLGHSGSGQVNISGPLAAPANGACSSVTSSALAHAATSHLPFDFTGDSVLHPGVIPNAKPGCYQISVTGKLTDTSAKIVTHIAAPTTVTVLDISVTSKAHSPISPTSGVSIDSTLSNTGSASVTVTSHLYGPLPAKLGTCPGSLSWPGAPIAASTTSTLSVAGTKATSTTGALTVGCYSSSVTYAVTDGDNGTFTNTVPAGSADLTTYVMAPTVTVADATYDGQQGKSMTGTMDVEGTWSYPSKAMISLVQAPTDAVGNCHNVSFANAAPVTSAPVVVQVPGDGVVNFNTPTAPANTCYSTVVTIALSGNHAITASSTPSSGTSFLAGYVASRVAKVQAVEKVIKVSSGPPAKVVIVIVGLMLFLVALGVFVYAFCNRADSDYDGEFSAEFT